jgi:hypothetical protein
MQNKSGRVPALSDYSRGTVTWLTLEALALALAVLRLSIVLFMDFASTENENGRGVAIGHFYACSEWGCSFVSPTDCSFSLSSRRMHELFGGTYSANLPKCARYLLFAWTSAASAILGLLFSSWALIYGGSVAASLDATSALAGAIGVFYGMGYWYSAFAASTGSEFPFGFALWALLFCCFAQFSIRLAQLWPTKGGGPGGGALAAVCAILLTGWLCALTIVVPPNVCGFEPGELLPFYFAPVKVEARTEAVARNSIPGGPVTLAFVGDTSVSPFSTRALYRLIALARADALVHLGDFDYTFSADAWDDLLTSELGRDFPVIASPGNHDTCVWQSYLAKISTRWRRSGLSDVCSGWPGVAHQCLFKGVRVVQAALGDFQRLPLEHGGVRLVDVLGEMLDGRGPGDPGWTVCAWHRNQWPFRVGHLSDGAPREAFDMCRSAGAPSFAAHDHLYARTRSMASFYPPVVADGGAGTVISGANATGVHVIVGTGGREVSARLGDLAEAPFWAKVVHRDSEPKATAAAVLCTFYASSPTDRSAKCSLVDISGSILDDFTLFR